MNFYHIAFWNGFILDASRDLKIINETIKKLLTLTFLNSTRSHAAVQRPKGPSRFLLILPLKMGESVVCNSQDYGPHGFRWLTLKRQTVSAVEAKIRHIDRSN